MTAEWAFRTAAQGARILGLSVLFFLTIPILVIIPLSFTSGVELVYPMPSWSVRWYEDFFSRPEWLLSLQNSLIVGVSTAVLASMLGTAAAFGLHRLPPRVQALLSAMLVLPMAIPVIIAAVAFFFFYAKLNLTSTYTGLILAHTTLALPFVVISVRASLSGLNPDFARAAASLGAPPHRVFRRVTGPLVLPGIVSGALFAFAVSFDDVVVAMFVAGPQQLTLPKQMFTGVRENISPTILAASSLMVLFSVVLMASTGALSARSRRLQSRDGSEA